MASASETRLPSVCRTGRSSATGGRNEWCGLRTRDAGELSPFAVEQMGTRKHDGDPGALEVVDRAFEFLGRDWTGID